MIRRSWRDKNGIPVYASPENAGKVHEEIFNKYIYKVYYNLDRAGYRVFKFLMVQSNQHHFNPR